MKVWIVTREINGYDQDGEYFEAVFMSEPTEDDLYALTGQDHFGRRGGEHTWYNKHFEGVRE